MEDHIEKIEETEWGLEITFKTGAVIDNRNVMNGTREISDRCNASGKKKVVIHAPGLVRHISVLKLMDIAEFYESECPGIRIAFIASHLVNNEDSRSLETFAFNRGVYIKFFHDKESGLEWLMGKRVSIPEQSML